MSEFINIFCIPGLEFLLPVYDFFKFSYKFTLLILNLYTYERLYFRSCFQFNIFHVFSESRRLGKTIMFIKATGPVVFSDSSSGTDEENNDSDNNDDVIKFSKISDSDETNDNEHPNKKKKLS